MDHHEVSRLFIGNRLLFLDISNKTFNDSFASIYSIEFQVLKMRLVFTHFHGTGKKLCRDLKVLMQGKVIEKITWIQKEFLYFVLV